MATIKTRMQYDESVMNHPNAMSIIAKQEKLAVKCGLYDDVKVYIDPESHVFYDIRTYVRTCRENENGHYMYIYFQYVPNDKYFCVRSDMWNDLISQYPPIDGYLDDTAMGKIVTFCESFHPSDFTQVSDFLVLVRTIAMQESKLYLKDK